MLVTLQAFAAPVLVAVLAVLPTAPTPVDSPPPGDGLVEYLSEVAALPPPPPPVPQVVATGSTWEYETLTVGIAPPPPPPRRTVRTYGTPPPLTGPILTIAANYIGTPYVAGGESPSGFDCSGFTQYVYAQAGISLPRTVSALRNVGTVTTNPQPGDLIWTSRHVGIYVAPGWQIDSPRPGKTVQVRPIWQSNPVYLTF